MKPLVAFAVGLLVAGSIVVIGLRIYANSRESTPVVLTPPVVTPLPDRVIEEKGKREGASRGNAKVVGRRQTQPQTRHNTPSQPGARRSPQTPRERDTPRTTPKPRPTRPAPSQPPQTTPEPSPPKRPPVDVKAPIAPVQVCTETVGVNC